ncbi:TetR/AcrR family transcriptional regulator, partial [Pseudomonas aeruginosa]
MARVGAEVRRQDFIEAAVKVIAEYGRLGLRHRRRSRPARPEIA